MKMRFYPFSSGTLVVNRGIMNNRDWGIPYEHPNPMFAIRHPKGVVVFDTGMNSQGMADPAGWWGKSIDGVDVRLKPADYLPEQLRAVGIDPAEVKFVVMSHLHIDHVGEMHAFPDATFIVRRSELSYAWWPGRNQWFTYSFNDLLGTRDLKYVEIAGDADVDLFGDGSLVMVHTPGHTPGHQSLIVTLPDYDRPLFLCQDACYTEENLGGVSYGARLMWCMEDWYKTGSYHCSRVPWNSEGKSWRPTSSKCGASANISPPPRRCATSTCLSRRASASASSATTGPASRP